jgi:UDP-N-acetylmuramoylalanine--D-glutamate ligase
VAHTIEGDATGAACARRAVVVGLGVTGLSVVRHLRRLGVASVTVVDSRQAPPEAGALRTQFPEVALHSGSFDPVATLECDLLVVSPGVSIAEPAIAAARARGVEPVGDIELFARTARSPVLAITGSNGKSTVTAMTGAICRAAGLDTRIGGNLGPPALDLLQDAEPAVHVLELSSFQLETTHTLSPRAAVVLNLSEDHLDRYPSMDAYAAAKARVYRGAGLGVYNRDDPRVMAMNGTAAATRVAFGLGEPGERGDFGLRTHGGRSLIVRGGEPLIDIAELPLAGRHNALNAMAAMALASAMGCDDAAMVRGLRAFTGLPHRCERVAELGGVTWINDSKGTNVGATSAALAGMDAPVVLIAGGLGKGQDFAPLAEAVRGRARAVVLIGRDAEVIARALGDAAPLQRAGSLEEAVDRPRALARPGDIVLLSPACSSFDMFRDYVERGERFRRLVGEGV